MHTVNELQTYERMFARRDDSDFDEDDTSASGLGVPARLLATVGATAIALYALARGMRG